MSIMKVLNTSSLFLTVCSFKNSKLTCYQRCKSTKVKALQVFNACHKDKHIYNSPHILEEWI